MERLSWSAEAFWTRVDQWQTLIGAGAALLAALVGAYFLHRQTEQGARFESDRLGRQHAATRAALVIPLSQVCDYAETTALALLSLKPDDDGLIPHAALLNLSLPTLPSSISAELSKAIETATTAQLQVAVADLLSMTQVVQARLRFEHAKREHEAIIAANRDSLVVRLAEIYGYCSLLFPYARRDVEDVDLDALVTETRSALFFFRVFEETHPELFDTYRRYFAKVK
jgi:hypothetical protein